MTLNPDCVRNIMLSLEDLTGIYYDEETGLYLFNKVSWSNVGLELKEKFDYNAEEIQYTLIQLYESGYVHMEYKVNKGRPEVGNIMYLSPKGHEFVAKIKDTQNWNRKVRPILDTIGSISLSIIESVSAGIASSAIEKLLN